MPERRAKRNSIIVLIAAIIPFALWPIFRTFLDGRPQQTGYVTRCGGSYAVWLLACCASASLACVATSVALFRTAHGRIRGHVLNATTLRFAVAYGVYAVAFALPFLGVSRAPCWVVPGLYWVVAVVTAAAAVKVTQQEPMLERIPNFEIDALLREGNQQLKKLRVNGRQYEEENAETIEFLNRCLNTLDRLKAHQGSAMSEET